MSTSITTWLYVKFGLHMREVHSDLVLVPRTGKQ